jgi:alkylation response protein AidB-like acyl-CoA dehydrogenase
VDFDLTKEQQLLSDAVQRFVAKEYPLAAREKILDSKEGWSGEIWAKLAELGLLSLQVPEEHGGMGGASVETMLTMNALGRGLLLEPYLPSAILATALIRDLGSPTQKEELLPAMAAGERIAVPAHGEPGARDELARVATTAARSGDGYALNGNKSVVLHAAAADALLVSARSSGDVGDQRGISLFIVPREARGVSLQTYRTLDGQRASDVSLRDVRVPASALLGPEGGAFEAISAAWDLGVAAICAEAAGALQALLDTTVEYAKTRKQFGLPIAKFQALQHRMVEMLIHVEQARSMSYLAAIRATDRDRAERRRAVSAAKVVVGQACRKVAQEAVQIHGGMGMTDELHVGHYFKRLTAIELSLGDTEHHLESFVRESVARKETA